MFVLLGINHNTASVDLRERLAIVPSETLPCLQQLSQMPEVNGVFILSTCNRTELYIETPLTQEKTLEQLLLNWLSQTKGVALDQLQPVVYVKNQHAAISQLLKVASGLDSMVLGEPQILGQLKSAYATALDAGTLSSELHRSFQTAFSTAKRIRTETAIGRNPVSVASTAVALATQVFDDLSSKSALLIGAGEMVRLCCQHLIQQGVKKILVANRTLLNAQQLAEQFAGQLDIQTCLLAEVPEKLADIDIVISSTASQLPILGKGALETALKARKHALMYMVDLAVPRDIEPQVAELDDVYLFSIDDLSKIIDKSKRSREQAASEAEVIVSQVAQKWLDESLTQDNIDLIKQYRGSAESLRDTELQRAIKAIAVGEDPAEVCQKLANTLMNKLLHQPTTQLNQVIVTGDEKALATAKKILGLNDINNENK